MHVSEQTELDDLIGAEEEVTKQQDTGEAVEAQTPDPEPEAGGEESPVGDGKSAPESVPFSALLEERTKRQELQRQIEELRRSGESQIEQKPEPEEQPDWLDDPEAAARHMQQQVAQATRVQVVNLSRSLMMSAHDDYAEREAEFIELAGKDPSLVQKMNEADNPALFAYETAIQHSRMKALEEIGDIEAWKAAERERIRAELQAETPAGTGDKPRVPPSMARATEASGGHVTPTNEALEEILGR